MEGNEAIVMRFVEELWNQRKLEVADLIFDADCCTHQLQSGVPVVSSPRGPAAGKAHVTDWLSGFPDLKFTVEQMFTSEDRVTSQLAIDGTHTGQWIGIRPTGKQVNIRMITIHRIQGGENCRGLGACRFTGPTSTIWGIAIYNDDPL